MRIAVMAHSFPSVSQTFVADQITGLIDRGHQVEVWAWRRDDAAVAVADGDGRPDPHGLAGRTRYLPEPPCSSLGRIAGGVRSLLGGLATAPASTVRCLRTSRAGPSARTLRPLIEFSALRPGRSYDAVLCHFGPVGLSAVRMRDVGLLRGPIATVFHGSDMTRYLEKRGPRAYDRLFAAGDLFMPISDRWRERLLELGAPAARTCVHRMGVRTGTFRFTPRRRGDGGPVRLASVARLVEKKGIEYAIRAVARAVEAGVEVRYVVVGDGPLRSRLEALVGELGVADVVELAGSRTHEQVAALLDASHLLLAPSVVAGDGDQEGIPVALMEAMAMGLPVLTTRHSGIPELVEDGVHGRMVPERDVDALAEALLDLVECEAEWPTIGAAARVRVEQQHDADELNDALVEVLASMGGTRTAGPPADGPPLTARMDGGASRG